jgi:HK97 family phage prohead protease
MANQNVTEVRTAKATELRANPNKYSLEGYAALYNVRSNDLGGFKEVIAPGAFDDTLGSIGAGSQDCRCLFNHDSNVILGRTRNSTLELSSDTRGLKFRCQLDKTNPKHQEIYALVSRGDVSECSFAFQAGKDGQTWDEDTDECGQRYTRRTITKASLFDVSCVANPAYPSTQVDARAIEQALAQRKIRPVPYTKAEIEAIRAKLQIKVNGTVARAENGMDVDDELEDDERALHMDGAYVVEGETPAEKQRRQQREDEQRRQRAAQVGENIHQQKVEEWLKPANPNFQYPVEK